MNNRQFLWVVIPMIIPPMFERHAFAQFGFWTLDPDSVGPTTAVLRANIYPEGKEVGVDFIGAAGYPLPGGVVPGGRHNSSSLVEARGYVQNLAPNTRYAYRARVTRAGEPPIINDAIAIFHTPPDSSQGVFLSHLSFFLGEDMRFQYELSFGVHHSARYCLDWDLGEIWLPPEPPQGASDFRFIDPRGFNGACMDQGIKPDIRPYQYSTQTDTYKVRFSTGTFGFPMKLSWSNVNSNYAGQIRLRDHSGAILNIDMRAQDSVTLSVELNNLFILASGPNNPAFTTGFRVSREQSFTFELTQNYPNPFNPSTVISYQLPRQSHVRLKVFDLLGREVAVLVDAIDGPGDRSVRWEPHGLAGGVYLYRLHAGQFVQARKLMLLK